MKWSVCLLGLALLVVHSDVALPATKAQRDVAIRALEAGDREAITETDNLQSYMKLKPGCISEDEVTDFFDRRKKFSDLREDAGSWRDADDATLHKALLIMRDNARADQELAEEMQRKAKSRHC
jgi:hypothetical protein